jgi:hypothetical protein
MEDSHEAWTSLLEGKKNFMALLEIFYCEFVQNLAIENLGLEPIQIKAGSAKNWTRIRIQNIAWIRILKKN